MSKTTKRKKYKATEDRVLRRGDRFRIGGGTRYKKDDGKKGGALRGLFEFREAIIVENRGVSRTFIEAIKIEDGQHAGTYTIFVKGRTFRRAALPGVTIAPYKIRPEPQAATPRKRKAVRG